PDVELVSVGGSGTCANDADITDGITCELDPGESVTLTVEREAGQQCEPGEATNQATLEFDDETVTSNSATVQIPGDDALCDVPNFAKTGRDFNITASGMAIWNI